MAKNRENIGLAGDLLGLAKTAAENIEKRSAREIKLHNKVTQQSYTIPHDEIRNKRIQIVVKPTVSEALDRLVKQKKIKSKNDLVNFLLEQFLEQNKE